MQLFEYAVVYLPEDDAGNLVQENCKIVTEPKTTLAKRRDAVEKKAIQEIAAETDLDLDFVQVLVRPFGPF